MAQVNREEFADVNISLPGQKIAAVNEWTTDTQLEMTGAQGRESLSVRVPPGGIRIIELTTGK